MPQFAYSAINAQGNELSGEIHAADLSSARDVLLNGGLLAERIAEIKSAAGTDKKKSGMFAKKVQPKSLQVFSRQFATMIEAGLSVVTALVILEEQTDDQALAVVIADVREEVETGALLSEAMAQHPNVFSRLYIAMVEAGEAAGVLDTVLDRVAIQIEKEQKIKRRIKGAMIYPSVVLVFATLVMVGMLMFLVPVFVKIFDQLGGELPILTQYVMHASNGLRNPLIPGLPIPGVIFFARDRLRCLHLVPPLEEDRARPREVGQVQAEDPDADRRRRPQGRDGPLVANALDADRVRRRHHARARDHLADGRQLGRRERDHRASPPRRGGLLDRAAADRERRLPADDRPDGEDRRGDG